MLGLSLHWTLTAGCFLVCVLYVAVTLVVSVARLRMDGFVAEESDRDTEGSVLYLVHADLFPAFCHRLVIFGVPFDPSATSFLFSLNCRRVMVSSDLAAGVGVHLRRRQ